MKPWLIKYAPIVQEFNLKIKDKKASKNLVMDHLSRLYIPSMGDINDTFLDKHLLAISIHAPWFAHIVNFLVTWLILENCSLYQKNKFFHELKYYF